MNETSPRDWDEAGVQHWLSNVTRKTAELLREILVCEGTESMRWWMHQVECRAQSDPRPFLVDEWHKLDTSSPEGFAGTLWEANPDAKQWVEDQSHLSDAGDVSELAELVDLVSRRGAVGTGHGE